MRIARVILRVADLTNSVAFWSGKVGLEVTFESGPFAFLNGGNVELVLNETSQSISEGSLTEIVFEASDVVAAFAELTQQGVPFEVDLRSVSTEGPRELMAAHFRDPDGHLASLTGWVARQ
jgi:catechol 2,3-dioxygenase-like lactoylglutathione lyase family enzyme